jgi:hypothetical protein
LAQVSTMPGSGGKTFCQSPCAKILWQAVGCPVFPRHLPFSAAPRAASIVMGETPWQAA